MRLIVEPEIWPYKVPFRVSRGAQAALDVVVATLTDADGHRGRGEAAGVDYHGETIETLMAQIESVRPAIEQELDGALAEGPSGAGSPVFGRLAKLLPAGGARNAVDCALWDLMAKRYRSSVWRLADVREPAPAHDLHHLGDRQRRGGRRGCAQLRRVADDQGEGRRPASHRGRAAGPRTESRGGNHRRSESGLVLRSAQTGWRRN